MRTLLFTVAIAVGGFLSSATAIAQTVVDIPTRPGVTNRVLLVAPPNPRAAVILLAGGHGGLQINTQGGMKWGQGNFVVRTGQDFATHGLYAVVVDAPSDRQNAPYLSGFRQTAQHVDDIKAVIAWVRAQTKLPVWLVGTSRGTQSAGYIATQLTGPEGPDGIVLTSTILTDNSGRPVPKMELEKVTVPVLVVHHENDGCPLCAFKDVPLLTARLTQSRHTEVIAVKGGQSKGDPCEAEAYHGYNGIEPQVVDKISAWILGG